METLPNLEVVRAVATTVRAMAAEADEPTPPTLEVRFSKFDSWYEICSGWEGNFMERTMPGAFKKTIVERRDQIKVLFDHGFDPTIGNKVLGSITDLREDPDSPVGIVDMFDTSYNEDLIPGLKAGVYGSSMRMRVVKDEWNDQPKVSAYNPKALPERTIREVMLFEFGPVTFPASPESTASARSMTDEFYAEMRSHDPERVDTLRSRATQLALHRSEQPPASTAEPVVAAETAPIEPPVRHSEGMTPGERRQRLYPNLTERN